MSKKRFVILSLGLLYCGVVLAELQVEVGNLAQKLQTLANMLGLVGPAPIPFVPVGPAPEPMPVPVPLVPPPVQPPAPQPAPLIPARDVLKTVGNVTQLRIADVENAQARSGYVAVYYALAELMRAQGQDVKISFDEFMPIALRSIKKRRVQVACRNYIANILTHPPYLVAQDNLPKLSLFKGLNNDRVRNIYHSLLSDLASVQAEEYVKTKYKLGKSVWDDSLVASPFLLQGNTLIADLKSKVVDRRRNYYIQELEDAGVKANVAPAALSALIDQLDNLKDYTHIEAATKIEVSSRDVLTELHGQRSFGIEEGAGDAMPQGSWLNSADIEHLLQDEDVIQKIGFVIVSGESAYEKTSIFDDLKLISIDESRLTFNLQERKMNASVILQSIVDSVKNKSHAFIINVAFDEENPNAINTFNWTLVLRNSDGTYIIVDARNIDRIGDANVRIIQDAFK